MQLDMIYDDFDEDLFNRRVNAKNIFNKFNQTTDEQAEERKELLKQLFGCIGENVYVEPTFKCEFGKNIYIGNNVYINFGAVFLDCSRITIGNNVLIGPNVGIYSANHSLDPEERAQGALIGGRITIGDKAWIAGDVKIMAGVTIGEGAVIGCGSIVTHDIPPACGCCRKSLPCYPSDYKCRQGRICEKCVTSCNRKKRAKKQLK